MKNILTAFVQFPYYKRRLLFIDYLWLKLFRSRAFPSMNIIPLVQRFYDLHNEEEFRVRYYISKISFEGIWSMQKRSSKEAIESFYNEHDADLWRQAYLSKYSYIYKKKILHAYHVARTINAKTVLDYGCGAGTIGYFLKQKGFIVDVADIESPTIRFVKKMMELRKTSIIDSSLQLPAEAYDYITCLDALEHTLTPLDIVKTLLKSLKTGGYFHMTYPKENIESESYKNHPQHTLEAQLERPAVLEYLRTTYKEIVPESIYQKV